EALHVALAEARHFLGVEAGERAPEILALAQDGDPAQARLHALEDQEREEPRVVVDRHAPLGVVVFAVERVLAAPGAALLHLNGAVMPLRTIATGTIFPPCMREIVISASLRSPFASNALAPVAPCSVTLWISGPKRAGSVESA